MIQIVNPERATSRHNHKYKHVYAFNTTLMVSYAAFIWVLSSRMLPSKGRHYSPVDPCFQLLAFGSKLPQFSPTFTMWPELGLNPSFCQSVSEPDTGMPDFHPALRATFWVTQFDKVTLIPCFLLVFRENFTVWPASAFNPSKSFRQSNRDIWYLQKHLLPISWLTFSLWYYDARHYVLLTYITEISFFGTIILSDMYFVHFTEMHGNWVHVSGSTFVQYHRHFHHWHYDFRNSRQYHFETSTSGSSNETLRQHAVLKSQKLLSLVLSSQALWFIRDVSLSQYHTHWSFILSISQALMSHFFNITESFTFISLETFSVSLEFPLIAMC